MVESVHDGARQLICARFVALVFIALHLCTSCMVHWQKPAYCILVRLVVFHLLMLAATIILLF